MNVVIIVVDTLRHDYARPIISTLQKEGFIYYPRAISPAPWTVPAHASLFTGLYPAFHGAHESRTKKGMDIKLSKKNPLLSSQLSEVGYTNYLFTANPYIRPSLGYRDFHYFYEASGWEPRIPTIIRYNEAKIIASLRRRGYSKIDIIKYLIRNNQILLGKVALSKAISSINPIYTRLLAKVRNWPEDKGSSRIIKRLNKLEIRNKDSFIFINLMEVHEPYFRGDNAEEVRMALMGHPISRGYLNKWQKIYPKQVLYVSRKIGDILGVLKRKRIFDNSLVIVTSDHGQLLGEYGKIGHGTFLYDELLKVPLLIKYPKDSQISITRKVNEYVSLVSLKPFILNFANNSVSDDGMLYSSTVFAESYGIGGVSVNPKTEEEKKNIEQLEKYRIAIYYKNFKGIFNVTDWKFEEIKSYDPNIEVTEDIVKHMKKEVIRFLKSATLTKVPKIKI